MKETKLIFAGPVGAGKTTAVRTLAEGALSIDEQASDMARQRKPTTTVVMDYGVVGGENRRLHLYGTPGQERFSFMWEIVAQGSDGLILLIDASRPNPQGDLRFYLDHYPDHAAAGRAVVGLTMTDRCAAGQADPAPLAEALRQWGYDLPVVEADARELGDMARLVELVVERIERDASGGRQSVA